MTLWDEMDTDRSGDIDFTEFRTWFVGRVSANAHLLEFQQKRARASRFAKALHVRQGPLWDIQQAQRELCGTTAPERPGSLFTVPDEWEKRIAAIMRIGCGRAMAIEALRQCNGHGGKARALAAAKLHVGPSNWTHRHEATTKLTDAEIRFQMQMTFLQELKRVDKMKVNRAAMGSDTLKLERMLGRVGLDYVAPSHP